MIFPLEQLVKYSANAYEITVAAIRRAYQMSMVKDPLIEENEDKENKKAEQIAILQNEEKNDGGIFLKKYVSHYRRVYENEQ